MKGKVYVRRETRPNSGIPYGVKGYLFKDIGSRMVDRLSYKIGYSVDASKCRGATPEEIELFELGFDNIAPFKEGDEVIVRKTSGYKEQRELGKQIITEISTSQWGSSITTNEDRVYNIKDLEPWKYGMKVEEKFAFDYKFKIGDRVTVEEYGWGIGERDKGKVVTIVAQGNYGGTPGYLIEPKLGNCANGGYVGEKNFYELGGIKKKDLLLEKAKLRYPIGTEIICPVLHHKVTIKGRYRNSAGSIYAGVDGNDTRLYGDKKWSEVVITEEEAVKVKYGYQSVISDPSIVGFDYITGPYTMSNPCADPYTDYPAHPRKATKEKPKETGLFNVPRI